MQGVGFWLGAWPWRAARCLLVVVFVASGLAKTLDFSGGVAEMQAAGLAPPVLFNVVVAVTLLLGSALILLDRALWLGAGLLAGFLLLSILIVHRFWALPAEQAQLSLYFALEHLSLVGGLLAAAIASQVRRAALAVPQRAVL